MRRILFLLFYCQAITFLSAQDLHLYYDAFSDSMYAMRNDRLVERLAVRKGESVVLHLHNYNNYLYNAEVIANEQTSHLFGVGGLQLGGLIPGGGFNPGSLFFGSGSLLSKLGVPGIVGEEMSMQSGAVATPEALARKAQIAELRQLESEFSQAHEALAALEEEVLDVQSEIKISLEAQQIQAFAADELHRLRYDPRLEPMQIRKLSREYMTRIFGEVDPNNIELGSLIKKSDQEGSWNKMKRDYRNLVNAYAGKVDLLRLKQEALMDPRFDFPESNMDRFRRDAEKITNVATENMRSYEESLQQIESIQAAQTSLDLPTLSKLRTDYIALTSNDFSRSFRFQAGAKDLELQMNFIPIDSANIPGLSGKTVPPFAIKVYGGLSINAGVGISFGRFQEQPLDYFVRDSVIMGNNKDAFIPVLTSFVHFYRQSQGAVSLGGSLGVGIPVSGEAALESITFLLGPSLVLGRHESIVISAGLMGGKVERLAQGYALGDQFEFDSDFLATERVYELGYFVGVSFNLGGRQN